MSSMHSFHIPVMGIGFTIDTPIKVAPFGISSVIFISDDVLMEKMRKMYSEKHNLPYTPITDQDPDARAQRVTAYLNLVHDLVEAQIKEMRQYKPEVRDKVDQYFEMLPELTSAKTRYLNLKKQGISLQGMQNWLQANLKPGSIDVNIMTKLDRANYKKKEALPQEFNDAHAALRGYAKSKLKSSVVFSAGMNPRLYSYAEQFEDFFPNQDGEIKKKIILKVSDYRSAMIQGKFLAKKGLWVSEYRVESGLNCGGHAFATDGFLMGPILQEFKDNREELKSSVNELINQTLTSKNKTVPAQPLDLRITAQGGVGTAREHDFLINQYGLDSIGWGTPFLLVPEATTVDEKTMQKLMQAKEKDLYLSNVSPLGVPFNNLHGNTKDLEKLNRIAKGRPGSACPKKFLALDNSLEGEPTCKASRQYQHAKLKELDSMDLTIQEHKKRYAEIVEPSCLCVGLGTTALLAHDIEHKKEGDAVLICPGPNMAYFSKISSLKEMVGHVYGRNNVIARTDRPHMFVKELGIYVKYLKDKIEEAEQPMNPKQEKYFETFANNLTNGIGYYEELFSKNATWKNFRSEIISQLNDLRIKLSNINSAIVAEVEA